MLGLAAAVALLACLAGYWLQARRDRVQVALVLRLENPDVLRNSLGRAGFEQLTNDIVLRLSTCLAPSAPVRTSVGGDFTAHLGPLWPHEIASYAAILRDWCEPGGACPLPAFSAALIRDGQKRVPEQEMISFGRKVLARQGPGGSGRITVITYDLFNPDRAAMLVPIYSTDWLRLRFQPQLCADTGAITGAEVEMLLDHPHRGILDATTFLPRLTKPEAADLVRAVVGRIGNAMQTFDRHGVPLTTMTLPLPQPLLDLPELADIVLWELDRQDIAPLRLSLALPEGVEMGIGNSTAWRNIERLSGAGCRIELGDFGIVGATFEGIKRAGATQIRIGRNFVSDCHHAIEQQRMILAILALAEHLGIATAALNVETTSELGFLTQIGLMRVQGGAVAAAMNLDEMLKFLTLHRIPEPLGLPIGHAG